MSDTRPPDDSAATLPAITALYNAAMQRQTQLRTATTAAYSLAFAYAGVVLSAMSAHPSVFVGSRAALLPLPVWVIAIFVMVMGWDVAPTDKMIEHLQGELVSAARVDPTAWEGVVHRPKKRWGIPLLVIFYSAAIGLLATMTIYCLVRASAAGWGWIWWAVLYAAIALVYFGAQKRSPLPTSGAAAQMGDN